MNHHTSGNAATTTHIEKERSANIGVRMLFDAIRQPGCYVCDWSGHLVRVSEGAIARGSAMLPSVMGSNPLYVTKISDDPQLEIEKAKGIARDLELSINF